MKVFEYKLEVEDEHLDLYGHVNNARYMDFYELARWDIFRQTEHGRVLMEDPSTGVVVLEACIRFRHELTSGQEISIRSVVKDAKSRIFRIDQEIIDNEGRLCSSAVFKAAMFDLQKRKIIKRTEGWEEIFGN